MGSQQRQSPSQTHTEQNERPKPTEIFNVLQNKFQRGAEPDPETCSAPMCRDVTQSGNT